MQYSEFQSRQHGGCPRRELVGSASSTAHNMTLSLRPLEAVRKFISILMPQRGSTNAIGCITFSAT